MTSPAELDRLLAAPGTRVHFVGVAGGGMSALALYRRLGGGQATGSDRDFDRGGVPRIRDCLERAGVRLFPQDGRAVADAHLVVASTAVEAAIADLAQARSRGLPVIHRSDVLASLVRTRATVAIAGSSGKSTVTAMTFAALRAAGRDPGLVTGAPLRALEGPDNLGNAWSGSGPLVIEADESDGSLVRYRAAVGVVLNLHRDHHEPAAVLDFFHQFVAASGQVAVGEDEALRSLRPGALVFGCGPDATGLRVEDLDRTPDGSRFRVDGVEVSLPIPGRYNVDNAVAALAACRLLGVPIAAAAPGLATFAGVARRFEILRSVSGVEVIDDFAHNPAKVAAALAAARERGPRVHAIFQPHGFGPARFMRDELVAAFAAGLRAGRDRLFLLEIYDAGGSANRDVTSDDLVADARRAGVDATAMASREELVARLGREAAPGDVVLVMGARDPSLSDVARALASGSGAR